MNSREQFAVNDATSREKVERLYMYLQIYHRLHCAWWNWTLPGTCFSLSATAVLAMYVGLRHTELPWYLYWIFWFAGFGVMLQVFGGAHDIMSSKDDSEDLVEKLQSSASEDIQGLSLEDRRRIMKRSKAITSLQFPISGFTYYTWSVPLGCWDEILNQLLFLLSL